MRTRCYTKCSGILKHICALNVRTSEISFTGLIFIIKVMNEWIKKMWDTHTHRCKHTYTRDRMLFSHKKEGNPISGDNMGGTWGHYSEWNKTEKDRYV